MKKKYYATIETKTLNVITIVVKAENKNEANEILKNNYNYKKVISLKTSAPTQVRKIHKESVKQDKISSHSNIYVRKSNRSRLFG